jgi:hypothetical protein
MDRIITTNSTNNKNKKYLALRDIIPQWFERINKILKDNDSEDIIFSLYFEINDYKRWVIGEAYGYDESYVIEGTKRYCQECTAISGNFSGYQEEQEEEIKMTFTKYR